MINSELLNQMTVL